MISSSKYVIQKLQEYREYIIFSDIIDRVNKLIDNNDIDKFMLTRKRIIINILIEECYRQYIHS